MKRLTLALTGALLLGLILPATIFAARPVCVIQVTPGGQEVCRPLFVR
jgi:hypothetical protein